MTSQDILNKFDKIYNDTYKKVVKYVVCSCKNIDDVSDIIQNIYLAILKLLEKKKDINSNYIMGICKHKVKDYYRFRYRYSLISLNKDNDDDITLMGKIPSNEDIEKEYIISDDIDKIWLFLKEKKVIIGKIFWLYYYEEYTIKEIAKELMISESNVKHYLYRTLKELNIYFCGGNKNG